MIASIPSFKQEPDFFTKAVFILPVFSPNLQKQLRILTTSIPWRTAHDMTQCTGRRSCDRSFRATGSLLFCGTWHRRVYMAV